MEQLNQFTLFSKKLPPMFGKILMSGCANPFLKPDQLKWLAVYWMGSKSFIETGQSAGHSSHWRTYLAVVNHPAFIAEFPRKSFNLGNDEEYGDCSLLVNLNNNDGYVGNRLRISEFLKEENWQPDFRYDDQPVQVSIEDLRNIGNLFNEEMKKRPPVPFFAQTRSEATELPELVEWQKTNW